MLKQLDTLIGFAVVMAIVSLLITIITQTVSSVLGLRGKNLADALEVMIYKICPQIGEITRKPLIRELLTHPIASDSILRVGRPFLFLSKWDPHRWWQWLTNRWKLASAIRPDELLGLLEEKAKRKADAAQGFITDLPSKLTGSPILTILETDLRGVSNPELRRALKALRDELIVLNVKAGAALSSVPPGPAKPAPVDLTKLADSLDNLNLLLD